MQPNFQELLFCLQIFINFLLHINCILAQLYSQPCQPVSSSTYLARQKMYNMYIYYKLLLNQPICDIVFMDIFSAYHGVHFAMWSAIYEHAAKWKRKRKTKDTIVSQQRLQLQQAAAGCNLHKASARSNKSQNEEKAEKRLQTSGKPVTKLPARSFCAID